MKGNLRPFVFKRESMPNTINIDGINELDFSLGVGLTSVLTSPGVITIAGLVGLDHGGTNVDLSAGGGAVAVTGKFVLKQDAAHVITSAALIATDIPDLSGIYLPLTGGTLTGDLLFSLDNTHDIGASGATRPRTIYLGTSAITPDVQITGSTGNMELMWNGTANTYDIAGNANALRLGPFNTGAVVLGQPGWQVFPNVYASGPTLQGQMYFDFGSAASSALIVREGQGGTVKERFRIDLNANFIFTKGTSGSGHILFTNDNVSDIGAVGATRPRTGYFGTSVLAPLFNAGTGFQVAGAATTGHVLRGNGTNFVDAALQASDIPSLSSIYLPLTGGTLTGPLTIGDILKITGNASLPAATTAALYIGSGYASDSVIRIQLASDDFNRADGALGANWTDNAGAFKIVSNLAACNSSADAIEFNHYSAVSFLNDQWAQATVTSVAAGTYIGLSVRGASGSTKTGYVLYSNGSTVFLSKMIAGSRTVFNGGSSIGTLAINDVVLLTVQGTTLTVYKNGVSLFSVVDSAIASGSPGIGGFGTAGTSTIDNWSAGVFNGPLGRIYVGDGTGVYKLEFAKRVGSVDTVLFTFSDSGVLTLTNIVSSVATGTQPYAATSTTLNTNLNADLLDGLHSTAFPQLLTGPAKLTGQSAAQAAQLVFATGTSPGAGLYRISYVATITTVDGVASVLGGANGFQIIFTNANGDAVVKTSNPTTPNISAIDATGTTISGCVLGYAAASTNINYSFGYTSTGGFMRYDLAIFVEYLGA